MNHRLRSIHSVLKQRGLDALLVCWPANISYLTQSQSRDSYFLVSQKENIYFTDSRYTEEAKKILKGNARLKECNGSVFKHIAQAVLKFKLKKVGIEERYLPFAEFAKIKEYARGNFDLIPTHSIIEDKRQVKDAQELAKLAGDLQSEVAKFNIGEAARIQTAEQKPKAVKSEKKREQKPADTGGKTASKTGSTATK